MKIAVMKERRAHERRVAATPETVKKFIALGFRVFVEAGAGIASRINDADYIAAGATIESDLHALLGDADIVLKVQRPLIAGERVVGEKLTGETAGEKLASAHNIDELAYFKRGSILLAILAPHTDTATIYAYAAADITAIALEFVPPTFINDEMVHSMRPGSVIVDLAAEQGGNCTLTKSGEIVEVNGVSINGLLNIPNRLSADASALYAKNVLNYLTPHVSPETKVFALNWQDEIVLASSLTHAGEVIHPAFKH